MKAVITVLGVLVVLGFGFLTTRNGFQHVHHTNFLKKTDGSWKIQRSHVSGGVVPEG